MDARDIRRERRHGQVREEILDAARAVILERGLPGLTLAAVARELQLTKAALYHYFPSKEAISFELIRLSLEAHGKAVASAVAPTTSGADAIEALIRTSTAHFATRMDELRMTYLVPQVGSASATRFGPEMLAKIRPFNEQLYGSVAEKVRQDQTAGVVAKGIDGRRLAFLAHVAVIGMLTVEGLVAVADDAPLIHPRDAMVDDLVRTFRARLAAAA
jgi:AcrR family transcriptional regulator